MTVPMHEFMAQHREEICRLVVSDLQPWEPEGDIVRGVSDLLDEVVRALQRHAGLPVSSPLPGASPTAMWLGARRQAKGYAISRIVQDIGAICNRLGEVGAAHGVSFDAREFQVFNQCIDSASAAALEEYWLKDREMGEHDELQRIGVVVHELRNTLAGARMALSVLRSGEVGILSRTGTVLDRSLRRLETLIGEMVFAVRLGIGSTLNLRPVAVDALLRTVLDAAVPERDIALKLEGGEGLEVCADEHLLISAVGNLLQNALKFTRDGGQVVIRAYGAESSLRVEVEDECGGLPPGKPEELFAPFVSKSTKRAGLGLGLTITRQAVEAHGGGVSVKNLPGKGCVFRLTIPLKGVKPEA
jgi:signal transduction histidine kinase